MPGIIVAGANWSSVKVGKVPLLPVFDTLSGALYAAYLIGSGYYYGSPLHDYSGNGRDLTAVGTPTLAALSAQCFSASYYRAPFKPSDVGAAGALSMLAVGKDSTKLGSGSSFFISSNNVAGVASTGVISVKTGGTAASVGGFEKTPTTITSVIDVTANSHYATANEAYLTNVSASSLQAMRKYTGISTALSTAVTASLVSPATLTADYFCIGGSNGGTGYSVNVSAALFFNRALTQAEFEAKIVELIAAGVVV